MRPIGIDNHFFRFLSMFVQIFCQSYRNQGIGIAAHNQKRAFNPADQSQIVIKMTAHQKRQRQRHLNLIGNHVGQRVKRDLDGHRGKRLFRLQTDGGVQRHMRSQRHTVNNDVTVLIAEFMQMFNGGNSVVFKVLLVNPAVETSETAIFRHKGSVALLGKRLHFMMTFSLALLLSGAIGNLIDRVALGYVRDMIYVALIDFAVFNVADMAVTVGCCLLVLDLLFFKGKKYMEMMDKKPQTGENS